MDFLMVLLQVVAGFIGAYLAVLLLGLVVWTYRDIRSRTPQLIPKILAVALVLVFNLLGLMVYLMLRPRETLAERYERSLEEEALLQALDDRQSCPTCKRRVEPNFLICPRCLTQLKQACPECDHALNLDWNACPYCGKWSAARV